MKKHSLRILVLTTTFPRYKNDYTPSFVLELSKEIKNKGHKIIVLAPHHKGAKLFEIMEGIEVFRFPYFLPTGLQRLCYEGGIMRNIKKSLLAKVQVPFFFVSYFYFVYKIIKKYKIDVIHSHWIIPSGFIGAFFKKIFKIKHITTAHAIDIYTLEKLPFRRTLIQFIYKNCEFLVCVSSVLKEKIIKILKEKNSTPKDKIIIKPMGTDIKFIDKKDKKDDKFYLLFLGRFVEKKGIEYLIEAMKEIKKENRNIKLLIGGSGPLEKKIKDKVEELNLTDCIEFLGWVPREKIHEVFKIADLLVVPSIVTETGDTEGMPTVIIEAMGAGVPVIATDVGGVKDVIRNYENGIIINQKNPLEIKEKSLEVYKNERLRKKIIHNAKLTAQNFTWDKIADFYIKLFL